MFVYALIINGILHTTYPAATECESAATEMAGAQYQAITQWAGGKSVRKIDGEWRVVLDGQVIFRASCQQKDS